ncbi:MAG: hypothetical protein LKF52_04730 [Butyrivibrio sp.]|jgi:hypothetical protein|nr:hypothetical protein [Butyrivibrio sp.]
MNEDENLSKEDEKNIAIKKAFIDRIAYWFKEIYSDLGVKHFVHWLQFSLLFSLLPIIVMWIIAYIGFANSDLTIYASDFLLAVLSVDVTVFGCTLDFMQQYKKYETTVILITVTASTIGIAVYTLSYVKYFSDLNTSHRVFDLAVGILIVDVILEIILSVKIHLQETSKEIAR